MSNDFNPKASPYDAPPEIVNMDQLGWLLRSGFTDWDQYGSVNTKTQRQLTLFDYKAQAQWENRWNWFERVSRGLILNNQTGEVVARPFDKFFNADTMAPTIAPIREITEKMDGSLGILYRVPRSTPDYNYQWSGTGVRHDYRISTRGNFTSEQAIWATEWLYRHYPLNSLENELTLLFEIIYPNNRVVVDYGGYSGLVLIGARNRFTGEELWHHDLQRIAWRYQLRIAPILTNYSDDLTWWIEAAKNIPANQEGWVIRHNDGTRVKVKGAEYLKAHKLMTNTSFKRVLEAVVEGTYAMMLDGVPDEFSSQVRAYRKEIEDTIASLTDRVESAFLSLPKGSVKEFSLAAHQNHTDIADYLFTVYHGRPLRSAILKHAFKSRVAAEPSESESI